MESYIPISNLNDFIFCPRSIYFHNLYGNYSVKNFHRSAQTRGRMAHESIEQQRYSTEKRYITALSVYSERFNIGGKIDIYDKDSKMLIERKRQIKTIYDGYRYQLYAQYFCMVEMNYPVKSLFFHSLLDNRRYPIDLPDQGKEKEFISLLQKIRSYDPYNKSKEFKPNAAKCRECIYSELCDISAEG